MASSSTVILPGLPQKEAFVLSTSFQNSLFSKNFLEVTFYIYAHLLINKPLETLKLGLITSIILFSVLGFAIIFTPWIYCLCRQVDTGKRDFRVNSAVFANKYILRVCCKPQEMTLV